MNFNDNSNFPDSFRKFDSSKSNSFRASNINISQTNVNSSINRYEPSVKLKDDKLWTPLMLHQSRATSIKEGTQIHDNSYPQVIIKNNEKQLLDEKKIILSADNIKKMCSSTIFNSIKNNTSTASDYHCDIDTIVPALRETTV